jgi:hypothetical protein
MSMEKVGFSGLITNRYYITIKIYRVTTQDITTFQGKGGNWRKGGKTVL